MNNNYSQMLLPQLPPMQVERSEYKLRMNPSIPQNHSQQSLPAQQSYNRPISRPESRPRQFQLGRQPNRQPKHRKSSSSMASAFSVGSSVMTTLSEPIITSSNIMKHHASTLSLPAIVSQDRRAQLLAQNNKLPAFVVVDNLPYPLEIRFPQKISRSGIAKEQDRIRGMENSGSQTHIQQQPQKQRGSTKKSARPQAGSRVLSTVVEAKSREVSIATHQHQQPQLQKQQPQQQYQPRGPMGPMGPKDRNVRDISLSFVGRPQPPLPQYNSRQSHWMPVQEEEEDVDGDETFGDDTFNGEDQAQETEEDRENRERYIEVQNRLHAPNQVRTISPVLSWINSYATDSNGAEMASLTSATTSEDESEDDEYKEKELVEKAMLYHTYTIKETSGSRPVYQSCLEDKEDEVDCIDIIDYYTYGADDTATDDDNVNDDSVSKPVTSRNASGIYRAASIRMFHRLNIAA